MRQLGVYGRGNDNMATSGAWQAQQIKTAYLKHKTLHHPIVCIMEQRLAELQRRPEQTRKVALSQNLMEHQILQQVLLRAHPARCRIFGIWFLKSSVQARLTTLTMLLENPETLSLMCWQGNTVYLIILLLFRSVEQRMTACSLSPAANYDL